MGAQLSAANAVYLARLGKVAFKMRRVNFDVAENSSGPAGLSDTSRRLVTGPPSASRLEYVQSDDDPILVPLASAPLGLPAITHVLTYEHDKHNSKAKDPRD